MDGNGWVVDGDGRRDSFSAAMDGKGWRERDADGL
jgi:hypothetical protein